MSLPKCRIVHTKTLRDFASLSIDLEGSSTEENVLISKKNVEHLFKKYSFARGINSLDFLSLKGAPPKRALAFHDLLKDYNQVRLAGFHDFAFLSNNRTHVSTVHLEDRKNIKTAMFYSKASNASKLGLSLSGKEAVDDFFSALSKIGLDQLDTSNLDTSRILWAVIRPLATTTLKYRQLYPNEFVEKLENPVSLEIDKDSVKEFTSIQETAVQIWKLYFERANIVSKLQQELDEISEFQSTLLLPERFDSEQLWPEEGGFVSASNAYPTFGWKSKNPLQLIENVSRIVSVFNLKSVVEIYNAWHDEAPWRELAIWQSLESRSSKPTRSLDAIFSLESVKVAFLSWMTKRKQEVIGLLGDLSKLYKLITMSKESYENLIPSPIVQQGGSGSLLKRHFHENNYVPFVLLYGDTVDQLRFFSPAQAEVLLPSGVQFDALLVRCTTAQQHKRLVEITQVMCLEPDSEMNIYTIIGDFSEAESLLYKQ